MHSLLVVCAVVGALTLVVLAASAACVAVSVVRTSRRVRASVAKITGAVLAARELAERASGRGGADGGERTSWADLVNGVRRPIT